MGPWACALPVISCKVVSILVFSVCLHAFDFLILRKNYKKAHSHSDPDSYLSAHAHVALREGVAGFYSHSMLIPMILLYSTILYYVITCYTMLYLIL